MKIVFDVGANDGRSTMDYLPNKENKVFMFEPTPFLLSKFLYPLQAGHTNLTVIPCAVSNFCGRATFNVAGQQDWGCSSLKTFEEGLERTWPGRQDFKVTEKIEVEVITLSSYIVKHLPYLRQIDYLHVDTQGSDLDVLDGLGHFLSLVKEGSIEVAADSSVALYKGNHTEEQARAFLSRNGFEVTQVIPNDGFLGGKGNERNLKFRKL